METRRLGRTEHMSTVAIYGGAALGNADQTETDTALNLAIEYGVNHIDVAPQYGLAEELLGPWMARERDRFFLGCKTMERTKQTAKAELHHSLEILQVDHFDLYQLHAITSFKELDKVLAKNGALEAFQQQRETRLGERHPAGREHRYPVRQRYGQLRR